MCRGMFLTAFYKPFTTLKLISLFTSENNSSIHKTNTNQKPLKMFYSTAHLLYSSPTETAFSHFKKRLTAIGDEVADKCFGTNKNSLSLKTLSVLIWRVLEIREGYTSTLYDSTSRFLQVLNFLGSFRETGLVLSLVSLYLALSFQHSPFSFFRVFLFY